MGQKHKPLLLKLPTARHERSKHVKTGATRLRRKDREKKDWRSVDLHIALSSETEQFVLASTEATVTRETQPFTQ